MRVYFHGDALCVLTVALRLLPRWLDVGVANITCTQSWVTYLRLLQEAVWPGGVLPAQPRPVRSPQQKEHTRLRALHCLMKLIPGQ